MEKGYPAVLVFYLDRELMANEEVFVPYTHFINNLLAEKEANMIALFIPTDREERVECINPIMYQEADMNKLNRMLDDINKSFQLGDDISED